MKETEGLDLVESERRKLKAIYMVNGNKER
jgi:hypothetical protein